MPLGSRVKPRVAAAAAVFLLTTDFALAQDEPPVEEVIVTAQRREESLQEVPVAVTALSQKFLEDRQITSIESIDSFTPNLRVQDPPGATSGAQLAIRGSVTLNPALSWDPAVGIYLDGVYIGKTQGSVFDFSDLERIEVLRGPQGTLYGRNSLSGAINLVSAKPTGQFGGSLKLGAGDYGLLTQRGSLNLSAIGPFKIKLSASHAKRDGFIDVRPDPQGFPTTPQVDELQALDNSSGRAVVLFDPGNGFTAEYAFDISDADGKPGWGQLVDTQIPALQPYITDRRLDTASIDGGASDASLTSGHSLAMTWDLSDALSLKSISAYRRLSADLLNDYDGTPVPVLNVDRNSHYEAYSQELQALGHRERFGYVIGAYYFEDDGEQHGDPAITVFDYHYDFKTRAQALYAQGDYAATDRLKLTAGARYTHEEKDITLFYAFLGTPLVYGDGERGGNFNTASFDNFSPTAIVSYKAAEDVNLYAKWARGYKSGGFNTDANSNAQFDAGYSPEKVDSYEIGAKTSAFENRLRLNAAAFYNKSKDMQISVFTGGLGLTSSVSNAGRATAWGIELESEAQVTRDLQFRASYSYLHPTYDQYLQETATPGVYEDVADNRVFPLAPTNTFSLGIDWTFARASFGSFRGAVDLDHTDSYYTYAYPLDYSGPGQFWAENNKGDNRTLLNARLSLDEIQLGSGTLEFAGWVRNLLDEEYVDTTLDFGPGVGGTRVAYYGSPRIFGLEVTARW